VGTGLPPGTTPVVTLYGTSWCGACRSARQYLTEKKIPFADKDIERDPAALRELKEKGAKLGVRTDRVPVLDVRGRLLLGFDRARIEALLGEPT
jgi:glutaredoxin